jgi:lysozyme
MSKPRLVVAAFTLSASAFVGLTVLENYRPVAYMPTPNDVPTIGFGTTEGVKMGDTITPPKALVRALSDVQKYEGAIKQCVKVPLHQYEYDAFVGLAYNIGSGAFCSSTLVKVLNEGRYADACAEISRWNRQGGKVLPGLVNRRKHERAICEGLA